MVFAEKKCSVCPPLHIAGDQMIGLMKLKVKTLMKLGMYFPLKNITAIQTSATKSLLVNRALKINSLDSQNCIVQKIYNLAIISYRSFEQYSSFGDIGITIAPIAKQQLQLKQLS